MAFWRKKPEPKPDIDPEFVMQFKVALSENRALKNQIEYLVRTIREMDDKIFAMSQCSDWPQMRKYFTPLSEGMTARKVVESRRITELLVPELAKTYQPQIEGKK